MRGSSGPPEGPFRLRRPEACGDETWRTWYKDNLRGHFFYSPTPFRHFVRISWAGTGFAIPTAKIKIVMETDQIKKGQIQVQTENIFPIIKKFLYADHDIFIRELVSNAVDANQKIKTLQSAGEFKGETGPLEVRVSVDKEAKTITFSDTGVGMTEEEVEKYLNQVAFSGAREFLEKYQHVQDGQTIIGHFGLGFYSAFMVAQQVEVDTLSWKEGASSVLWTCDGSPEYSLSAGKRTERGTTITLHVGEDGLEFLETDKVKEILVKYGKFLPIPVFFQEEQINNTQPAWTRKPADVTEEDYTNFYKELYPQSFDNPLFHIHLNVDYPFNLTGILYFPRISEKLDLQRNKISLYSKQVFITESVENIVPEYLTLLHGVIDSPDIPLNVSRSYLQADGNVKKISGHISKKVTDKLEEMFRQNREDFTEKWENIRLFVQYGSVTDAKFGERAEKFTLFKTTDQTYLTPEELKEQFGEAHTNKDGKKVWLYTHAPDLHVGAIRAAKEKGHVVLVMDSHIEAHYIGFLESRWTDQQFVRIDAGALDKLIDKGFEAPKTVTDEEEKNLKTLFEQQITEGGYMVKTESLPSDAPAISLVQPEFIRRMEEMQMVAGKAKMWDMQEVVVNVNHPLMRRILEDTTENQGIKIRQAVDLAMLSKGLLKGEALDQFIRKNMESL
jgi:molecular chaperone HtpG